MDVDINEILIALWRKVVKRPGPAHQLLVEETKHVSKEIAMMDKDLSPLIQTKGKHEGEKLSFLLYHWSLFYQEGLSLLGEVPNSLGKLLSIGAPYGPYAVAGAVLGAREATFLDIDFHSITLAAEIAGKIGVTLQGRHPKDPLEKNSYDTVVVDHMSPSLEEIDQLSDLLKPGGFLLIVEGASKEQNRPFLEKRDHLVERGFSVQAPCIWKGPCPGREFNFPCFAKRSFEKTFMIREIQKYGGIEQNFLKMSYLLLKKKKEGWPTYSDLPLYRVVSSALDGPSGKRFTLCGSDGRKRLNLTETAYPKEGRAFSYLKRGEVIHLDDELRKGDEVFAGKETKAKVVAALGKPLIPEEME